MGLFYYLKYFLNIFVLFIYYSHLSAMETITIIFYELGVIVAFTLILIKTKQVYGRDFGFEDLVLTILAALFSWVSVVLWLICVKTFKL